jgi:clan AA aspartic protease
MSVFRHTVTLVNAADLTRLRDKRIQATEVRQVQVPFLVDTGAYMLCINEAIKNQLGLDVVDQQEALLANGEQQIFDVVGPVEIRIFNRRTLTEALVLPGNAEPLLGSIPLEAMDVIMDPRAEEIRLPEGRPYVAQTLLKGVKKKI